MLTLLATVSTFLICPYSWLHLKHGLTLSLHTLLSYHNIYPWYIPSQLLHTFQYQHCYALYTNPSFLLLLDNDASLIVIGHQVLLVGMLGALEDLESCNSASLELVSRQHAGHGSSQHLADSLVLNHPLDGNMVGVTGLSRLHKVLLLLQLGARKSQLLGVDNHHVVATVVSGVVDGLVLTLEGLGNGGGQSTKGSLLLGNVHKVPCSGKSQTCLG